jgi:hypothetical protein
MGTATGINLCGVRFGAWVVMYEGHRTPSGVHRWWCRCSCGSVALVRYNNLTSGVSESCGCVRSEKAGARNTTHHEAHRTPEYAAWKKMKERCLNPGCRVYPDYGGRGITVCPEWLHSYHAFLACVGRRPPGRSPGGRALYSLGRIENNGNYEPGNVEWQTQTVQCNNKRNNRRRVA